jgi:hypothetical protein
LIPNIKELAPSLSADNPVTAREVTKGVTLELVYKENITIKRQTQDDFLDKTKYDKLKIELQNNPLLLEFSDKSLVVPDEMLLPYDLVLLGQIVKPE